MGRLYKYNIMPSLLPAAIRDDGVPMRVAHTARMGAAFRLRLNTPPHQLLDSRLFILLAFGTHPDHEQLFTADGKIPGNIDMREGLPVKTGHSPAFLAEEVWMAAGTAVCLPVGAVTPYRISSLNPVNEMSRSEGIQNSVEGDAVE